MHQIGLVFVQKTSYFCEYSGNGRTFADLAMDNAKGKALVVKVTEGEIVIGADTIVVLDNEIFGKPKDADEAGAMLRKLSGKKHEVFTGVCVKRGDKTWTAFERTDVFMRILPEKEIDGYVATGEPLDKAGAYGIQGKGALLIEKIEGCYFNVVGLPLVCLRVLLEKAGFTFEY